MRRERTFAPEGEMTSVGQMKINRWPAPYGAPVRSRINTRRRRRRHSHWPILSTAAQDSRADYLHVPHLLNANAHNTDCRELYKI